MKIALLLPSILASKKFESRIYAPKELFVNLADGLVNKGHEVFVYSSSNLKTKAKLIPGDELLEEAHLHSIKDIHENQTIRDLLSYGKVSFEYGLDLSSQALSDSIKEKFDIIHAYADITSYYFTRLAQSPVVFTLHDPVFPRDTLEYWRLKKFADNRYIAISENQKKHYTDKMGFKDVRVVYHGIDLKKFEFSPQGESSMVMIGRFIPEKGFEDGIAVSKRLEIPLVITSSPNYETTPYYLEKIHPFISPPLISKLGFLHSDDRSLVLKKAKVLLFPIGWEEPFGLTMVEAMACGTPVIAYAQGSVPEIVRDGVTGFIVNRSDTDVRGDFAIKKTGIEGLAEAVKKIYSMSKADYEKMRKACRKHVENNFSKEKMVEDHERVYAEIINKA